MKKRALVAGGAGFVGSHLCELLLEKGYLVDVADNLVTGRRENIEHLFNRGLNWFDVDINNLHILHNRYDEIYNLASPASPADFEKMPEFILRTASVGHTALLSLAREQKAKILFASTSEVYGDPLEHPQSESYWGNVNPIGPRGCYDEAKRFGEALTMAYHRQHGVETRIVRIFNTYGPRMRPNDGRIIPNFFAQALRSEPLTVYGDGTQTRSFCYVTDLVEGIYKLMQSQETRPVNLGNPIELTVSQMAETVNRLTGNKSGIKKVPLPVDDPKRRWPDIRRAREVLNWEPKVSLEEGLKQTLNYFKTQI